VHGHEQWIARTSRDGPGGVPRDEDDVLAWKGWRLELSGKIGIWTPRPRLSVSRPGCIPSPTRRITELDEPDNADAAGKGKQRRLRSLRSSLIPMIQMVIAIGGMALLLSGVVCLVALMVR
jgi:hypothetical protein